MEGETVIFPLFPQWLPEPFEVVQPDGSRSIVEGNSYRGLGVHLDGLMMWRIVHLNSGHTVRVVPHLDAARLLVIATDLADAADWTFSGLMGWQNVQPDLPDIMADWHRRWLLAGEPAEGGLHDEAARAVAAKRLS